MNKGQLFWHYSIIVFFLILPVMTCIDLFKYYVTHTYEGVRTVSEMATWSSLTLIPMIAFYYIQKRRLKFKIIDVTIDGNTFHKVAIQTAKQLEWEIIKQTNTIVVARSGFSWRSWGELITIIRDNDRILFNSICDPENRPSVASWGMNKLNQKVFEDILEKTASNISGYCTTS